jgi:hypothetical protein
MEERKMILLAPLCLLTQLWTEARALERTILARYPYLRGQD